MARPGEADQAAVSAVYRRLRALTLPREDRASVPLTESSRAFADAPEFGATGAVLDSLPLVRDPLLADDKVMLARDVWKSVRFYCERVPVTGSGDSGWYIGPADPAQPAMPEDCVGVRAADLLARCPQLAPVLELAAGHLVVFEGPNIEAVLTPDDVLAWQRADAVEPRRGATDER